MWIWVDINGQMTYRITFTDRAVHCHPNMENRINEKSSTFDLLRLKMYTFVSQMRSIYFNTRSKTKRNTI